MSGDPHNVIQLGLELLQIGSIASGRLKDYKDAFSSFPGFNIDNIAELKLAGLRSIFSDSSTVFRYYAPCELHPDTINYPDLEVEPTDFSSVKPSKPFSQNALVQLERYGSFVATNADPQIPVYDLFKTAAAVHDCLESAKDAPKEKKCILVGCDFSGIQDTVYTISSKGALKTLRARSFMLELLTEHIIYEILKMAEAGRHAIIYSGGGGFGLLLPNKEGLKENIGKYGDILNEWAYSEFFGKLFIALDALPFKGEDLKTKNAFQALRQEQADDLDKQKRRRFITQLDKLFEPKMPEQLTVNTECQITRRDDLDDGKMRDIGLEDGARMTAENKLQDGRIWVSESSYHQFKFGDALADILQGGSICRSGSRPARKAAYFNFPNIKWTEKGKECEDSYAYYYVANSSGSEQVVWRHNDWSGDRALLYANYVRKHSDLSPYAKDKEAESLKEEGRHAEGEHTATFTGLAASSCGADLIGALRMDVDDMGKLFADIEKLSELSAMSRMLNLFFKVYLNRVCTGNLDGGLEPTDIVGKNYTEKNKGRNVSVIYAGGDDLFILGAWDETAELAFDIQRCFALFTGGRGISGGLTLHQPKFPLYQMAKKSGEAEHVAKQAKVQKNCFTPFLLGLDNVDKRYQFDNNKTVRIIDWDNATFFKILKNLVALTDKQIVDNQIDAVKLEGVSRGFIYKLFESAKVWVIEDSLYLPRLRYIFARLEKQYDKHKNYEIQRLRNFLFSPIQPEREKSIKLLSLTLNWFEQLQRSK